MTLSKSDSPLTKIREKYPQYKDMDDYTLADRVLKKYPQYKDLLGGFTNHPPITLPPVDVMSTPRKEPLTIEEIQSPKIQKELATIPQPTPIGKEQRMPAEAVSEFYTNPLINPMAWLTGSMAGAEQGLRQIEKAKGEPWQTVAGATKVGFGALTPAFPPLAAFTQIGGAIGTAIPQTNIVMSPISTLINPQTETGKAQAEIADLIYQGIVAHKLGKTKKMETLTTKAPEIKTTPDIEKLAQPVRDLLIKTGEKKEFVNKLSLTELQKLAEQKKVAIPPPKGELPPNTKAGEPITPPLYNKPSGSTGTVPEAPYQPDLFFGADFGLTQFGKNLIGQVKGLITEYKPREVIPDPKIQKVRDLIAEAKPLQKETRALYREERAKRVGELAKIQQSVEGEKSLYASLATQKGELPKAQYEPIREKVGQADVDYLHDFARTSEKLDPYEKLGVQLALDKLFTHEGTKIPTKSEIALLEKAFGKEFAQSIFSKLPFWQKFKSEIVDALNIPRTLMSAFDMSMPLRQGVIQTVSHPVLSGKAFKEMHRAFFSEKSFKEIKKDIDARPNNYLYKEFKLDILDPDIQTGSLTRREESFTSHLAERIPFLGKGVRMSERAAYTYLNKTRADVFDMYASELKKAGIDPKESPRHYEALANWVNYSTGRGTYGSFTGYAPTMSAFLFSPRLLASRFQILNPVTYARMPKEVRVMAMKDMVKFVGSMTALLTLAKAGGADVGTDPRSSEFGKIKVGNTRLDVWGGFVQIIRFLAQLSTGEKTYASGRTVKLSGKNPFVGSRLDLIYRFGESKLNPHVGMLVDWLRGKSYSGEPFEVGSEAIQHLAPLYLQDAYDAMKDQNVATGIGITIPAFYGVGSTTYKPKSKKMKAP